MIGGRGILRTIPETRETSDLSEYGISPSAMRFIKAGSVASVVGSGQCDMRYSA